MQPRGVEHQVGARIAAGTAAVMWEVVAGQNCREAMLGKGGRAWQSVFRGMQADECWMGCERSCSGARWHAARRLPPPAHSAASIAWWQHSRSAAAPQPHSSLMHAPTATEYAPFSLLLFTPVVHSLLFCTHRNVSLQRKMGKMGRGTRGAESGPATAVAKQGGKVIGRGVFGQGWC